MAAIPASSILVHAPGFGSNVTVRQSNSTRLQSLGLADWTAPGQAPFEIEIPPQERPNFLWTRSRQSLTSSPVVEVTIPEPEPGTILLVEHPDGTLQFITPEEPTSFRNARMELRAIAAAPRTVSFKIPVHDIDRTNESRANGLRSYSLIGGFVKKIVFWVIKKVVGLAAPVIERNLKTEAFKLLPGSSVTTAGGSCLILTHGIFSSIQGAFAALDPAFFQQLTAKYPGGVWGFDHWTVQKSPVQNAQDLQANLHGLQLSPSAKIDLLCHSRGGAVHRCLLEHPALVNGNTGLNFNNAYFVAGANQGSQLAVVHNIVSLVNGYLALAQITMTALGQPAIGQIVRFLGDLLLAAGEGLAALPGVAALNPASDMYTALNGPQFTPLNEYIFSGANFDPKSLGLKVIDDLTADKAFKDTANDMVVPFEGTGVFDRYISDAKIPVVTGPIYGSEDQPQGAVHHLNFFSQPEIQQTILDL